MNFFERRKILKKANYLNLTPVRMREHALTEEGKVDILVPRFKNKFWTEVYRKSRKGEYIRIHLDPTGSALWLSIDGEKNAGEISLRLLEQLPEKFTSGDDAEKRVTQFLSLLYQQEYISFREILK